MLLVVIGGGSIQHRNVHVPGPLQWIPRLKHWHWNSSVELSSLLFPFVEWELEGITSVVLRIGFVRLSVILVVEMLYVHLGLVGRHLNQLLMSLVMVSG